MERRVDDIELGQALIGQVHRPVRADVAFDPGEQREAVEPGAGLAHRAGVRERARFVQAVGHRQRLAVIGDGEVVKARRLRRPGHRLDRVAAVRRGRVAMQVAAKRPQP